MTRAPRGSRRGRSPRPSPRKPRGNLRCPSRRPTRAWVYVVTGTPAPFVSLATGNAQEGEQDGCQYGDGERSSDAKYFWHVLPASWLTEIILREDPFPAQSREGRDLLVGEPQPGGGDVLVSSQPAML